ncbi:MAG: helix-hairpin-helix domain-containing protein [bacterium]
MNNSHLTVFMICGLLLTLLVVSPVVGRSVDRAQKNYAQLELPELKELSDEEQEEDTGEKQAEEEDTVPAKEETASGNIEQLKADSAAMKKKYEQQLDRMQEEIKQLEEISTTLRDTITEQKMVIKDYADTVARLKSDSEQMRRVIKQLRGDTSSEHSADTQPEEQSDTKEQTKPVDPDVDIPFERPLNPNEASLEDLKKITELSDRLAERIQWYRDVVRSFNSREDLRRVPGIGADLYEKIKHYFQPGSYE